MREVTLNEVKRLRSTRKFICSMTSWKGRIDVCLNTIKHIFDDQTQQPDLLVLNLSSDEFVNKYEDLPASLIEYERQNEKFKINWVKENTKPFKKILPIVDSLDDDDLIISIDDDIIYPSYIFERMLKGYCVTGTVNVCQSSNAFVYPVCDKKLLIGTGACQIAPAESFRHWEYFYKPEIYNTNEDDVLYPFLWAMNGFEVVPSPFVSCDDYNKLQMFDENSMSSQNMYTGYKTLMTMFNFFKTYENEITDLFKKNVEVYLVGGSNNHFIKKHSYQTEFFVNEQHDLPNEDKNNNVMCELSALYYLWKHSSAEIVGIEHYRRYFLNDGKFLTEKDIKDDLQTHDFIISKFDDAAPMEVIFNRILHESTDTINLYISEANKLLPGIKTFMESALKTNRIVQGNRFICKKDELNEYCEFLFSWFNNVRALHDMKPREFGYYAEYFFLAYLNFKNKKLKWRDYVQFNKTLSGIEFISKV